MFELKRSLKWAFTNEEQLRRSLDFPRGKSCLPVKALLWMHRGSDNVKGRVTGTGWATARPQTTYDSSMATDKGEIILVPHLIARATGWRRRERNIN